MSRMGAGIVAMWLEVLEMAQAVNYQESTG